MVIGVALGPIAVAVFSTTRTLTRFALLAVETVKSSVWPELSTAYGAGNRQLARKLHRHSCQIAILFCGIAVSFLLLAGRRVYTAWTGGLLPFEAGLFGLLTALVFFNSIWNSSSIVSVATNSHERIALLNLGSAALSVVAASIFARYFGLSGAATALLVVDLSCGWYIVRQSLISLDDSLLEFLLAFRDPSAIFNLLGVGQPRCSFR